MSRDQQVKKTQKENVEIIIKINHCKSKYSGSLNNWKIKIKFSQFIMNAYNSENSCNQEQVNSKNKNKIVPIIFVNNSYRVLKEANQTVGI